MKTVTVSRTARSQEKKAHIYRTAMQLFKHQGFARTTIRDICREAGISNGTFYHFFGDKSGVVLEFFQQIHAVRETCLKPTAENLSRPFQSLYSYFLHVAALQDLMGKEFTKEAMYSDPDVLAAQHLTATRQSGMVNIAKFLQAAIDAGTVPSSVHPWNTAELLITGASGVIFNWVTISAGETAMQLMQRLLPQIFSVVTNEPLHAGPEYQFRDAEREF